LDGILKTKQMITEKLNEAWNVVLGDGGQFDISLRHINQQISGFNLETAVEILRGRGVGAFSRA
jgi:hypothetical protein